MSWSEDAYDELAGVVDLFGALTREELREALDELAFKRGEGADGEALGAAVADAVDRYYLVEVENGTDAPDRAGTPDDASERDDGSDHGDASDDESGGTTLLAAGPVAFPTLPEDAEDLPLILDVPRRELDRAAVGERVAARLAADAEAAVDAGDEERIERLLDASYDLEAWAPVEAAATRETLDEALGAKTEGEQG